MGKKKQKQHQHKSTHKRSDAELIQAAERASDRGKWKDALAAYKELNKRQPGQFQDALTQVQLRRYESFLERDLFESAEQLLDAMRGQLPADQLKKFELQGAISRQDADAIAALTWQRLEQQQASDQELDLELLESLVFSESQPPPALVAQPEVKTMLLVRTGLRAICADQSEPLAEAMAGISRQSPLAQWKILLRALEAWYSGSDETLRKCLDKLTEFKGVGGRITVGLRLLVQENTPDSTLALASAFALHGIAEPEVATDLVQTDSLCDAGKYEQAFDHAAAKFAFGKTDKNPVEASVLDYFVSTFKAGKDSLEDHIHAQLKPGKERQSAWFPFLQAQFAEWRLPCDCIDCIDEFGRKYLKLIAGRGASRQVQARAHVHLADEFLANIRGDSLSPRFLFYFDSAIDLLKSAMDLDPDFTRAGLLLIEAHRLADDEAVADKVLDQLAAKHTDNASILQMAGKRCLQSGTFVRGLKQLEQALAIDPHLPSLKQDYIQGLLKKAQADYKKGDYDKGLACFTKMRPYLRQNRGEIDYWLDSDLMCLRQLELEVAYHGETAVIQQMRTSNENDWSDRPQMREALQYLFIELLGSRQRQADTDAQKNDFFAQKTLPAALPPEQVLQLFKILKATSAADQDASHWAAHLRQLLDAYRMHYQPERLEGLLRIFWEVIPEHIDPEEMLETCKLWSKADRHHPQLKILVLAAKLYFDEKAATDHLAALEQALETARQRNDSFALEKGKLLRKEILEVLDQLAMNQPRHSFADEDESEDDWQDEDEEEDQQEFDFLDTPDEEGVTDAWLSDAMESLYTTWRASSGEPRKLIEEEILNTFGNRIGQKALRIFRKRQSKERA